MLPKIYGVYSMKHEGIGGIVRFVIMENKFNAPVQPMEIYDLKGSTVGRKTSKKEQEHKRAKGKICVLKDMDIKRKFWLDEEDRTALIEQLKIDTEVQSIHNLTPSS